MRQYSIYNLIRKLWFLLLSIYVMAMLKVNQKAVSLHAVCLSLTKNATCAQEL